MTERPKSAYVEIDSIERWPNCLVATLRSGEHLWQLECDGADLTTYAKFQALAANQLGLWAKHESQDMPYPHIRRMNWQYAVSVAFDRGHSIV